MADRVLALEVLFAVEAIVYGLLVFLLYSFYQGYGRRYVKFWGIALLCLTLQYLLMFVQQALSHYGETSLIQVLLSCCIQTCQYLFLLMFCMGTYFTNNNNYVSTPVFRLLVGLCITVGISSSLFFAFDDFSVFNRFYLRESLPDFIFAGAFLTTAVMVINTNKLHFSSRILMVLSFILTVRYLFTSFSSILLLTEPWFQIMLNLIVYFDFGTNVILGFTMLIWLQGAERKSAELAIDRAQYLGRHDQLTGALNREQVIEKLPNAIKSVSSNKQKLAIYLIDIKRFKFVNDTYGLKTGDLILGEVANRLSESVMMPLVVGRLSGDSFVFAIEVYEDSQQDKAAKHLHDLVSRAYYVNHKEVHIQCSIGYCLSPTDGTDAEDLLQQANLALFHAETQNLPSVKYIDGMQAEGRHLLKAEKEIRQALAKKEFVLYFQPQLNLLSNRIDGVEALVRWQHPTRGVLPPGEFLEDIEALGLSGALDNYVLEQACQTNALWYKNFKRRVTIAVNISAVEFQDPKIIAKIQSLLFKYEIPSNYLELEITENVVITDIQSAMDTIVILQNMGIKVSIDDFGTGYSSLAYLRELPIDKIKIDRSFIEEFTANDSDLIIVKSMIKLSHGLGKRVLAEGVETQEQLDLLRKLGCDAVQGYFINPPLPEAKLAKYLTRK